ncbi:MAG TPA: RNA polymerase sigma-70 factor [Prolixibacteraceae bacterium]|nr:RNA polymerase sigma-70 factor [Prolixibacteraceae bacterium]
MYSNPLKSFNEIYNSYYRKSFLYVRSYLHDDLAAEDIVSDSLIKLWEQMKKEDINPIAPYLFTILKNRTLDHLKHQIIRRDVHGAIEKNQVRDLQIRTTSLESSDPTEIFSAEIQQIIEATLKNLPEKTREIFLQSRFGNKSHKEIAAIFGISVKGVDYHILQSVSALRIALKDYLPIIGFISFLN